MKHDLNPATRDSIEKDWLKHWNERLRNLDRTPRQVMHTYVEALDITVTHLDEEMNWDCWDFDAFADAEVEDVRHDTVPVDVSTPIHHLNPPLSHPQ